ncbi:P-type ATPase [Corynebacterium otitidis]
MSPTPPAGAAAATRPRPGGEPPARSLTVELTPLTGVGEADELAVDLNSITGVSARVVYPARRAWLTLEPGADAEALTTALERRGLRAGQASGRPRGACPRPAAERETALRAPGRRRLVAAVLLAAVVVAAEWLRFPGWQWVSLAAATPAATWCAWPLYQDLVRGMRGRALPADAPGAMAVAAAWAWSTAALLLTEAGDPEWTPPPGVLVPLTEHSPGPALFFDVACGATVLLLGARALRARKRPGLADELKNARPDPAERVAVEPRGAKGARREVPLGEVTVGDDVVVPPGAPIPVDGVVVGGSSRVGPGQMRARGGAGRRRVGVGDEVEAGAVDLDRGLKVRAARTGHRTRRAAVERLLAAVEARQRREDRKAARPAARAAAYAVALAAAGAALWWAAGHDATRAFAVALAGLACAAPAALAGAEPAAYRAGLDSAAREGLVASSGRALAALARADTILLDRSGALAGRRPQVCQVAACDGESEAQVVRVAAALLLDDDSPAGEAVVRAARASRDRAGGPAPEVRDVTVDGGRARGTVLLGGPDDEAGPVAAELWRPRRVREVPPELRPAALRGGSPLLVSWGGRPRGVVALAGTPKPDAGQAVSMLRGLGLDVAIFSRDPHPVARRFAAEVGAGRVVAGVAPERRGSVVRAARARGRRVAVAGGPEMMPALAAADAAILLGHAGDAPLGRRWRGVLVDRDDAAALPELVRLARRARAAARRGRGLAAGYHALAIAAALAGLLHPLVAAGAAAAASLAVAGASRPAPQLGFPGGGPLGHNWGHDDDA